MATHKRVNEKTPNGGAYSEIFYFDDNGHLVDEKEATRCSIRECDSDGNLIRETHGIMSRH